MCNYVEDDLDMTQTLMGATVVHAKPDVMRFEVRGAEGATWVAKVTIRDGRFHVERED